jgi:diacylglycerol O-acyltransferase / wax synthase
LLQLIPVVLALHRNIENFCARLGAPYDSAHTHSGVAMRQLSGLDATFLYIETPEMPMHVGGLHLLAAPSRAGAFVKALREHMGRRMHLAPVFHRKLALMPLGMAHPVWVEDASVDLDWHIREIKLPKPGTLAQVHERVGALHAELMDRTRPLWQFFVVTGLAGGKLALYTKLHHAAIDGQAGVAVANAVLDLSATPREVAPSDGRAGKRVKLGTAELVGAALSHQLMQINRMVRMLPDAAKTVTGAMTAAVGGTVAKARKGKADRAPARPKAGAAWALAPRTRLNTSISATRTFASTALSLAEVKAISKQLEVSLNDVVLGLCSGALRAYLKAHKSLPAEPLIAAVPVSLRAEGDASHNNQVTMFMVNLASNVADPIERVRAIQASTLAMKAQVGAVKSLIPTDYPTLGTPWLVSGIAQLYGRAGLADRLPTLANLVISNVPGPQFPLFLAGAQLETYHPVSIPVHGMALNITVQSYNGSLDFGLIACGKTVPDVGQVALALNAALDELRAALASQAGQVASTPNAKPTKAPAKKSAAKTPVKTSAKTAEKQAAKTVVKKATAAKKLVPKTIAAKAPPAAGKAPRQRTAKKA